MIVTENIPNKLSMVSLTTTIDIVCLKHDSDSDSSPLDKSNRGRESLDTLCTESLSMVMDDVDVDASTDDLRSISSLSLSVPSEGEQGKDEERRAVPSNLSPVPSLAVVEKQHQHIPTGTSSSSPSVRFSNVEIRSYPMVLGDNPSVTSGVPITIDWEYEDQVVCDVAEYEKSRPARRVRTELLMPSSIRARLAIDAGSSRKELQQQQRRVNIQRSQRRRTLQREQLEKIEEALETTWRVLSGKKQQERKLFQRAFKQVVPTN
jgi:hypothetical protein